jgi:hypothetical protein
MSIFNNFLINSDLLFFANQDDISRLSNSTTLLLVNDDSITADQKRRAVKNAKDYLGIYSSACIIIMFN